MYPEGSLLNLKKEILVVFEKDLANPENEGFVGYWEINDSHFYKLVFKKRLSKIKAKNKWDYLLRKGWSKINLENKVA